MKTLALSLFLVLLVSACSHMTSSSKPQFSIFPSDVSSATAVVLTNNRSLIEIQLSDTAATNFEKFTQEHIHKTVQILVGKKVIGEPEICSPISGGWLALFLPGSKEGQTIADALNKK